MERAVIIGLHYYDPLRTSSHHLLESVKTDPQGLNWTEIINSRVYRPHAQRGIFDKVTYDVYGTLDYQLGRIDKATRDVMRSGMVKNGVADSGVHGILPDFSAEDRGILVEIGIQRFKEITGKNPQYFWTPEGAIDYSTLETLAEYRIKGFICSPDQVRINDVGDPSNQPTRIPLPSGRSILALPFDRFLSHKLAFDDNPDDRDRSDAYRFTDRVILPAVHNLRNGFPLFGWTDAETFGQQMEPQNRIAGVEFIDWLVNHAIPEYGVKVVSLNDINWNEVHIAEGSIVNRSAWSCIDGDLSRWHGACLDGSEGLDIRWKGPFYAAVHTLNAEVTGVVKGRVGGYRKKIVSWFEKALGNNGVLKNVELSLIGAKVSALLSLTSCGTFFADPAVSGGINILFAREAVERLSDAGLEADAKRIWSNYLDTMRQVIDPTGSGRNGVDMAFDLLGNIDRKPASAVA